jgi:hypothetical protein
MQPQSNKILRIVLFRKTASFNGTQVALQLLNFATKKLSQFTIQICQKKQHSERDENISAEK